MSPQESESSLPTTTAQLYPSSPPDVVNSKGIFGEMDNKQTSISEGRRDEVAQEPIDRPNSTDTERPPSAQRINQDVNESDELSSEHSQELEEELYEDDPAEKIEDFDWEELQQKYHESILKYEGEEAELTQEWADLMNVLKTAVVQENSCD